MNAVKEGDNNKLISKLMRPLEPVQEEMLENSELETPLSEVIDVTRKKGNGSKSKLCETHESRTASHTSSISDKFANSSRR